MTDGGYEDERFLSSAVFENSGRSKFYGVIRAKHEIVNRRIKKFYAVSHPFRLRSHLNSFCLHETCSITELVLESGEPLFGLAPIVGE